MEKLMKDGLIKFKTQQSALDYLENNNNDDLTLCVFAAQNKVSYCPFYVCEPENFWKFILKTKEEKRNFYEIIPDSSPCFLYYDIEYEMDKNINLDGSKITKLLIDITCSYIKKYWNYNVNKKFVLVLDSTRTNKFSKHVIFSTEIAFINNLNIMRFINKIVRDINDYVNNNINKQLLSKFDKNDVKELYVNTSQGKQLFMDLSVYSKNRLFRIYKSTKIDKNSYFQIDNSLNDYFYKNEADIFINSLISYFPKKKKLVLLKFKKNKAQIFKYSNDIIQMNKSKSHPISPFDKLNAFVDKLVLPGTVRKSVFYKNQNIVVYQTMDYRYCENIGRAHKNNNIYFVVDLVNKLISQKCHDEHCIGYQSSGKSLPDEVTSEFKNIIKI